MRNGSGIDNKNYFDRLITALLPLPFFATGFLNLLAFVILQDRFDLIRKLFVFGTEGIVALLLLAKCLQLWKEHPKARRVYGAVACIPLFFGVLYGLKILTGDLTVLTGAVAGGCILLSCCCALLIVWSEKCAEKFFRANRVYALISTPITLFYCIRFYFSSAGESIQNLGVIDYMSLAYTLLAMGTFLMLGQLFFPTGKAGKNALFWLDTGLYILFSVAITLSGTKGTMLCLIFGSSLAAIYMIANGKHRKWAMEYPVIALLSIVLFSTVLYPDYGAENRLISFLKEGNSVDVSVDEMEYVSQEIDASSPSVSEEPESAPTPEQPEPTPTPGQPEPTPTPGQPEPTPTPDDTPGLPETPAESPEAQTPDANKQEPDPPAEPQPIEQVDISGIADVISYVLNGDAERDYLAGRLSEDSYQAVREMCRKLNNTATGGRKYLWACALKEIKAAPLTGQGLMFYQTKYGTYPHNFFLELAADFGLPVMIAVALLGLYIFLCLFRYTRRFPAVAVFLLYVLTYLPQRMVSGSLYSGDAFFQYGLCILLVCFLKRQETPGKETHCEAPISISAP